MESNCAGLSSMPVSEMSRIGNPSAVIPSSLLARVTRGYFTLDSELNFTCISIRGNADLEARAKELVGKRFLATPDIDEILQLKAELQAQLEAMNALRQELTRSYDATIAGWSRALDLRDEETEGHSQRVTEMTLRLAEVLGLDAEAMVHIRRGALLHDMGKLGVPDAILLKPGPLTPDEWEVMRLHPTYAYEMLYPVEFLRPALDIPYCHHEKWDGTGYPNELSGDQIPFAARIFAVADVWDALRSNRPYRNAWSEEEVHRYILSMSGLHFDPVVVEAFRTLAREKR